MKFLHLSDLHIGKIVNGFSMIPEQKHAFEQIIGYIKVEQPAAAVVAGDVYDRAIPSIEAVRVFDDFLTELASVDVAVLLIYGNHDSPERINYASRLLYSTPLYKSTRRYCNQRMAYSVDFRKKVLEFLDKGHTMREGLKRGSASGCCPNSQKNR